MDDQAIQWIATGLVIPIVLFLVKSYITKSEKAREEAREGLLRRVMKVEGDVKRIRKEVGGIRDACVNRYEIENITTHITKLHTDVRMLITSLIGDKDNG